MTTIALAGAGNIGTGLLRLLSTTSAGKLLRAKTVLVRDPNKSRPGLPEGIAVTTQASDLWNDPEVSVVVELLGGVTDSLLVVSSALKAGKSVVTANKNLMAEHGPELFALARKHGVCLGFEASVCGGIPIIRTMTEALRGDRLNTVEGIVNGTTNYLLTRMSEERATYAQCLVDAQRLGFAEPDPEYDVSGKDAVCKAGILATLAFGGYVDFRQVPTAGIESLELEDIRQAEAMGYRIKLIASARRTAAGFDAEVGPVLLPLAHPLASIRMEDNAVLLESDFLVKTLLSGKGAGPNPTALSLLADLLDLAEGRGRVPSAEHPFLGKAVELLGSQASQSRFYVRTKVPDRPGVLAQVAGLFGKKGISIASVLQPEVPGSTGETLVPLILTTHTTIRSRLNEVLAQLEAEGWGTNVVLRIQED